MKARNINDCFNEIDQITDYLKEGMSSDYSVMIISKSKVQDIIRLLSFIEVEGSSSPDTKIIAVMNPDAYKHWTKFRKYERFMSGIIAKIGEIEALKNEFKGAEPEKDEN